MRSVLRVAAVATFAVGVVLTSTPAASASPDLCGSHSDHDGWAFGREAGDQYVTAC